MFNILVGTTGSGKSWIANLRMWLEIQNAPDGALMLFTGNTAETLYDNVIAPMLAIDGRQTLEYVSKQGHERLVCKRNGVEVACVGANTERAQDRIFGKSVYRWYADEVQKQPASFVEIGATRCRWPVDGELKDTPCIWTLNPDDPSCTVKKQYIDRIEQIDGKVWVFDFNDNPTIKDAEAHRNRLANKMTGVLRDRLVYGVWTTPVDAVVPEFAAVKTDIVKPWTTPKYYDMYGALDPAYNDYTAYIIGYYDFMAMKYVIENESFAAGHNSEEIATHMRECENAILGTKTMYRRVSDTDLILIADLNSMHGLHIVATKKDDKEAQINSLRVKIMNKEIIINPRCVNLIRQLETATWATNKKTYNRVEGEGHYDMIDALIYLIRNIDVTKNPYPLLDENVKKDDYYIAPDLQAKIKLGDAAELATAFTRRK